MVCVYEGLFDPDESSLDSSGYVLTDDGQLLDYYQPVEVDDEFYFLDISTDNMYYVRVGKQNPVKKYNGKRLDDLTSGKMYMKVSDSWVGIDVPTGALPEIEIVYLSPTQSTYSLDISNRKLAFPLKSSDFQTLTPIVNVSHVKDAKTLSYLYIVFRPGSGSVDVRLVYKILIRKPNVDQPTIQFTKLEKRNTLEAQTHKIYFADHHGDIQLNIPNGIRLISQSSSSLVSIDERVENDLLHLTLRHRVEGNDLPNTVESKIPRSEFDQVTLYQFKSGKVYRGTRLLFKEDYSEIVQVQVELKNGQIQTQNLLIEYGCLLDKQISIHLEATSDQVKNGTLDVTDELLDQINDWSLCSVNSVNSVTKFYLLSDYHGFDRQFENRCVLKLTGEAPIDQPYFLVRRVLVQGSLRPIQLHVRVNP